MGQVIIRNLDDALIASLKARADALGKSLEQELRDVLARSVAKEDFRERAAALRARLPRETGPDSTDLIREDRDR